MCVPKHPSNLPHPPLYHMSAHISCLLIKICNLKSTDMTDMDSWEELVEQERGEVRHCYSKA